MKGLVMKSTGSWYTVLLENHHRIESRMRGQYRLQDSQNTNPIAVGDKVELDIEEDKHTGIINEILSRKNYIIRNAGAKTPKTHIIAANIDQCFLMVTLHTPHTTKGFVNRFLVTAEAYEVPVILLFNKTDLYSTEDLKDMQEFIRIYEMAGYTCIKLSALKPDKNILEIVDMMKGKINLLSGNSGVGKSTFLNAIDPSLDLKTGNISNFNNKGIHTTTFAEMFELKKGGFLIDTPGIKGFGLADMKKEEISHYFPEMRTLLNQCKFANCLHVNEPNCAVKKAVDEGKIHESRYMSYLSILHDEEDFRKFYD
jgi:ribosome biogenesis GTPase